MIRSQRFLLQPTRAQADLFRRACGVARYVWNRLLALRQYGFKRWGRDFKCGKVRMSRHWTRIKKRLVWPYEVSKFAGEQAVFALDRAYQAAFARHKRGRRAGFPRFKSKRRTLPSYYAGHTVFGNEFAFTGRRVFVPKVGHVKTTRLPRWSGCRVCCSRIYEECGKWWLTLTWEVPDPPKLPDGRPPCGVDLGVKTFAVIASNDGAIEEVLAPKPYAKAKRRLKRVQRVVSRRKKGSNRRRRAVLKLAKAHQRVANIRANFLHRLSRRLVRVFGTVVLEELAVAALARSAVRAQVHDLGWAEFRRQVEYKADAAGTRVVLADRFYPSSKTCHRCGQVKADLTLSDRTYRCDCGWEADRDHNAALNLCGLASQLPASGGKVTRGETGGAAEGVTPRRCRSANRECLGLRQSSKVFPGRLG